jgi:CRP/FNR family transcriptional regulator
LNGGDAPEWVGVILSGIVKLLKMSPDGRRQIVAMQFPGQFVGRPGGEPSPFIAEAATDVELCCFSGTSVEGLMREHRELEHVMMQQMQEELDLAREWMFVLGRKTAQEKVASLLLMLAHHAAADGQGKAACGSVGFDLPLSRTEMAEYLGLTIETVSRQMSNLKAHGVISIQSARQVHVPDLATLQEWSERDHG